MSRVLIHILFTRWLYDGEASMDALARARDPPLACVVQTAVPRELHLEYSMGGVREAVRRLPLFFGRISLAW